MDPRLVQLARILNTPLESPAAGRAAVSARPADIAEAFILEAAASDDVISADAALDYLEVRLAYLGDLVEAEAANLIRDLFRARISAW